MLTRRRFLQLSAAAGVVLILPRHGKMPVFAQGVGMLDPTTQPKFLNPVPNALDPGFIFQPKNKKKQTYKIGMYQFQQWLGLIDPVTNAPLMTTVWGYGDNPNTGTFPGKTFEVQSNQPIQVKWTNDLVDQFDAPLPHILPVDESLHWAFYNHHDPQNPMYTIAEHGVPVVPHVHGAHTESDSDGLPEYWFTPGWGVVGPRWVKKDYVYDNDQEAGTIWYHDHGLGITRLNVYAGLAGFFIIRDDHDTGTPDNPLNLPAFPYEVAVAVQDRMFDTTGQLYLPTTLEGSAHGAPAAAAAAAGPIPNPTVVAEFFGDHVLVNGVAWPNQDVEPRHYRYRLLNGSDSRFYVMHLQAADGSGNPTGPYLPFYQIGTDNGLLPQPVTLDTLIIGPGERADLVIDFSAYNGQQLVFTNTGPDEPFRGLNADGSNNDGEGGVLPSADAASTGRIMSFAVNQPLDPNVPDSFNPAGALRDAPFTVAAPVRTRKLVLFEGEDQYGRLRPQLGIWDESKGDLNGSLMWDEAITELPNLNDIEEWEVYNATEDAHPIHLHLVAFEILGRRPFVGEAITQPEPDPVSGGTKQVFAFTAWAGPEVGPAANEAGGPKDTAQMYPGEMTRIRAKFDRPGRYVWHCHILSHEDHEMMRPYYVGLHPSSFYPQGAAYWAQNSVEGNPGFDYHWLQISMAAGASDFMGGLSYYAAMTAGGGTWFQLARAVIATRLNLLAGVAPGSISPTLTEAEDRLAIYADTKVIPAGAVLDAVNDLINVLTAFNNGTP